MATKPSRGAARVERRDRPDLRHRRPGLRGASSARAAGLERTSARCRRHRRRGRRACAGRRRAESRRPPRALCPRSAPRGSGSRRDLAREHGRHGQRARGRSRRGCRAPRARRLDGRGLRARRPTCRRPRSEPLAPLSPYAASKAAAEVACDAGAPRGPRRRRRAGVPARRPRPGRALRGRLLGGADRPAGRGGGGTVLVGDLSASATSSTCGTSAARTSSCSTPQSPAARTTSPSAARSSMRDVLELLVGLARRADRGASATRRAAGRPTCARLRRRLAPAGGDRLGAYDLARADAGGHARRGAPSRSREDGERMSEQAGADHRHHRPGRLLPRRAAAREGLRGVRHGAPRLDRELRAHRPPRRTGSRSSRPTCSTSPRSSRHSRRPQPDEVYNLAAQSFVPTSWKQPVLTAEFTAVGVTRLLEAIRARRPRASASTRRPRRRCSARCARCRRARRRRSTRARRTAWRRSTGTSSPSTTASRTASSPSRGSSSTTSRPRRGLEFVTRKISDGVARIKLGLADELRLGNLDAERDWGFAGDYVEAMWLMLQADEPDDYVIATGEAHSVREFADDRLRARRPRPGRPRRRRPGSSSARPRSTTSSAMLRRRATKLGWEPRRQLRGARRADGRRRPGAADRRAKPARARLTVPLPPRCAFPS